MQEKFDIITKTNHLLTRKHKKHQKTDYCTTKTKIKTTCNNYAESNILNLPQS